MNFELIPQNHPIPVDRVLGRYVRDFNSIHTRNGTFFTIISSMPVCGVTMFFGSGGYQRAFTDVKGDPYPLMILVVLSWQLRYYPSTGHDLT
jgi:hypothetical protein